MLDSATAIRWRAASIDLLGLAAETAVAAAIQAEKHQVESAFSCPLSSCVLSVAEARVVLPAQAETRDQVLLAATTEFALGIAVALLAQEAAMVA